MYPSSYYGIYKKWIATPKGGRVNIDHIVAVYAKEKTVWIGTTMGKIQLDCFQSEKEAQSYVDKIFDGF